MIIAIDGPAAAGKGTLARRLAAHFGFAYLDTGRIYRAIGMKVLRAGGDPSDEAAAMAAAGAFAAADLDDAALASEAAADAAARVATMPAVRETVLAFQRDFAHHPPDGAPGAVLDGRDIGTVVCPEAEIKLFVTANVEERARRRHKELLARGEESIYARVLQEMKARDARDRDRAVAPLRPADDAFVLDTSALDADAAFRAALSYIEERIQPAER